MIISKPQRILLLVLTLILQLETRAQLKEENEKTETFCKVWGFLKYYHPAVTDAHLDWDLVFLKKIKQLHQLQSPEQIQSFYSDWLEELGPVKNYSVKKVKATGSFTVNADFRVFEDSSIFSKSVLQKFGNLKKRNLPFGSQYVQRTILGTPNFKTEKVYADSVFPGADMRILSLSRYWNIIQYFFPYKYVIGEDWNAILKDMLPLFREAKDTTDYHLAMLQLTVKINDSHALFSTKYTNNYLGTQRVPFYAKPAENAAVVTFLINDSLCKLDDLQLGDVILKIDGKELQEHLNEKRKYIPASNESVKWRSLSTMMFSGHTNTVSCLINRHGQLMEKTLHRYAFEIIGEKKVVRTDTFRLIDSTTAYLNLGLLRPSQTKTYLKKIRSTGHLIIDVRNYPNGTLYQLSNFLNPSAKPFASFTKPDFRHPGYYSLTEPYYCGRKNRNPYKGTVVVLFNEKTQSHAEFTVMALKTATNVICIGSQTSGADGNISTIIFPGNYKTMMTGLGVYFPDGRETQRIGMVPDIAVKPTAKGLSENRDEVLEKALDYLKSKP